MLLMTVLHSRYDLGKREGHKNVTEESRWWEHGMQAELLHPVLMCQGMLREIVDPVSANRCSNHDHNLGTGSHTAL